MVESTVQFPKRKSIRLPRGSYEQVGQPFFLTLSTFGGNPFFRRSDLAELVFRTLFEGPLADATELFAACLMPSHIHLLIAPRKGNLVDLIGRWKAYTTCLARRAGINGSVWQRSFFDHAVRGEEDLGRIAEYIVGNPLRAGLVSHWRQYPYAWHRWMNEEP